MQVQSWVAEHTQEAMNGCLSLTAMFLSLCPFLSLSQINKHILGGGFKNKKNGSLNKRKSQCPASQGDRILAEMGPQTPPGLADKAGQSPGVRGGALQLQNSVQT